MFKYLTVLLNTRLEHLVTQTIVWSKSCIFIFDINLINLTQPFSVLESDKAIQAVTSLVSGPWTQNN